MYAIVRRKRGSTLGLALIALGIVFMVMGAGSTLFPFSTIGFNSATVTNVPTFSAIGIVIFISGIAVFLRRRYI
jgi:membrane associated rhomboid family serine protease